MIFSNHPAKNKILCGFLRINILCTYIHTSLYIHRALGLKTLEKARVALCELKIAEMAAWRRSLKEAGRRTSAGGKTDGL